MVDEVVAPALERILDGGGKGKEWEGVMKARDIEAICMIKKGFEDLSEGNPALGWRVLSEILAGVNEFVSFCHPFSSRSRGNLLRFLWA